ncbi:MAG: hypothetical protein QOI16_2853, partial [Pseudonocardiales bacterium]|nr:hypothetical protein [Pseudonocardiales bacterium]
QTLLALVRAGIGIGVVNAVALGSADLAGLVVLDIDDPSLVREVAAYWYDVLMAGSLGMELHRVVVTASPPPGGTAPEE